MRKNCWNVKVLPLSPIHDPLTMAKILVDSAGIGGRGATREEMTINVNNACSGTLPRAAPAYPEANTKSKDMIWLEKMDKL